MILLSYQDLGHLHHPGGGFLPLIPPISLFMLDKPQLLRQRIGKVLQDNCLAVIVVCNKFSNF